MEWLEVDPNLSQEAYKEEISPLCRKRYSQESAFGDPLYINYDEVLTVMDGLIPSSSVDIVFKNGSKKKLCWPWNVAFMRAFKNKIKPEKAKIEHPPKTDEKFPYEEFTSSPIWDILEKELTDLVSNNVITITTHPRYVIGALIKRLAEYEKAGYRRFEEK